MDRFIGEFTIINDACDELDSGNSVIRVTNTEIEDQPGWVEVYIPKIIGDDKNDLYLRFRLADLIAAAMGG